MIPAESSGDRIHTRPVFRYRGGGYKVQHLGVYKVQQVRVYKVSLFFAFGKWVFIRSTFFNFHMVSLFLQKSCICFFCGNASL